jgi:MFS family permease
MTSIGISAFWIGLLDGIIESVSFFMKLFSGLISDYLKKRKKIILIGYGLTIVSMFMMGLSGAYASLFSSRLIGRSGNGMQATPRDAMVGDVAPKNKIGSSFGLMRSLGVFGSIVGAGLSALAMIYTQNDFKSVFSLAIIPAILAFLLVLIFVKEPKEATPAVIKEPKKFIKFSDIKRLDKKFWYLMGIVSIYMFDHFSCSWTTLMAYQRFNLSSEYVPLVSFVFCISYCLSSYPIGLLSDKIGRHKILLGGISVLMIADLIIACAPSLPYLFAGIFLMGCQTGISTNIFASLVTDHVPKKILGTAFGLFYLFGGFASILSGILGGFIVESFGLNTIFMTSFFMCIFTFIFICMYQKVSKK